MFIASQQWKTNNSDYHFVVVLGFGAVYIRRSEKYTVSIFKVEESTRCKTQKNNVTLIAVKILNLSRVIVFIFYYFKNKLSSMASTGVVMRKEVIAVNLWNLTSFNNRHVGINKSKSKEV